MSHFSLLKLTSLHLLKFKTNLLNSIKTPKSTSNLNSIKLKHSIKQSSQNNHYSNYNNAKNNNLSILSTRQKKMTTKSNQSPPKTRKISTEQKKISIGESDQCTRVLTKWRKLSKKRINQSKKMRKKDKPWTNAFNRLT